MTNSAHAPRRAAATLTLLAGVVACAGCADPLAQSTDDNTARSGVRALSADSAFRHLRRDHTRAAPTDTAAILGLLAAESTAPAAGSRIAPATSGAADLLLEVAHSRVGLRTEDFVRNAPDVLYDQDALGAPKSGKCSLAVDLSKLQAEFLLPHLDRVPVRNQANRGTCAAFAGVGAIEYAILNPDNPTGNDKLKTLDLSEQRYYFNSKGPVDGWAKPDSGYCQGPTGCTCPGCAEGSDIRKAMDASLKAADLDIPAESNCPYNPQPGKNDTQYPHPSSCETGVVKVAKVGKWCGFDEAVKWLHKGYALPIGTRLTKNWEHNDGFVSKEGFESAGGTVHAGGHAYLIVGYRKLPGQQDEGGMCFVVKNSWKTGWGADGYACVTLAWFQAVDEQGGGRLTGPQWFPLELKLGDMVAEGVDPPPDQPKVEDDHPPDVPPEPAPKDDDGEDPLPPTDEPKPKPAPPKPAPVAPDPGKREVDEYIPASLRGPDKSVFKVVMLEDIGALRIRGDLRGGKQSHDLVVQRQGDDLLYDGDAIGRIEGADNPTKDSPPVITLCAGKWGRLCSLRYRESDSALFIQFRDDDMRAVRSDEIDPSRGSWVDVALGKDTVQLFLPKDAGAVLATLLDPKVFVRRPGKEASRVALRDAGKEGWTMKLNGAHVGRVNPSNLKATSLCSGEFANNCVLVPGARLDVVPSNKRHLK